MLREKFCIPEGKAYLCGHSLGPMPVAAAIAMNQCLNDFGRYGVGGWNQSHWIDLPFVLAEKMAALLGAKADEVTISDSTVVNLYKCLKAALKLQKKRTIILTTEENFPADLYIAQGLNKFEGIQLKTVKASELPDSLDETVAVMMLTHVNYRDASVFDMQRINQLANEQGILTVWDLSHSVGIVPLQLDAFGCDFAVGCTYKYLSGGPGSPSFIYANRKHHGRMLSPIQGWLGHCEPFRFNEQYHSKGVLQFMGGTPPVFSLKALEAALDLFDSRLIQCIYEQSMQRSAKLIHALKAMGLFVYSAKNRGGHVAFSSPDGYGISRALISKGYLCDYRSPDLVRICVNPLYVTETELDHFIADLKDILEKQLYLMAARQEVKVP